MRKREPCQVCGEPNASKHYGSFCCSGCKGFFRRSVRYKRKYTCQNGGNCAIRAEYRNCCRACRFAKCLEANLNPLMVHGDRGNTKDFPDSDEIDSPLPLPPVPILRIKKELLEPKAEPGFSKSTTQSSALVKSDREHLLDEECKKWQQLALHVSVRMCDVDKPLSSYRIVPEFDRADPTSIAKYFVLVEHLCDDYFDSKINHLFSPDYEYHHSTDLPAEKAFLQPRSISIRTPIDWTGRHFLNSFGFKRMWCRIVAHFADWVSHIPEVSRLSDSDRLRLVCDRIVPCIDILIAHRGLVMNTKGIPYSGGSYFPRDEEEQQMVDLQIRPYLKRLSDWLYDEIVIPGRQMQLSETEYALLRLLTFFIPVDGMSESGKKIVRDANSFYRHILCREIQNLFPHFTPEERIERLSTIMSFLPKIEMAKTLEDEGFSVMTLFNIASMKGELTYEVHVRKGIRSMTI